ncbi:MAG: tetratricopeptide repeat protein [Bacteroidetes bacterium]|nr:tetratricopeptide repeat protein [Bacteroidota bacterium]
MKKNMLNTSKITSYTLILFLFILSSCVRPQVTLQKEIEKEEAALNFDSMPVPDRAKAEQLIALYLKYANEYQDDTLSPSYLFKAGELHVATGKFNEALDLFGRVQRYPNYNKVAAALFLQGFVAENHLRDTTKARNYYEKFIDTYPQHELAGDARTMLQQLSLSPEALIDLFEKNNAGMDTVSNSIN